MPAVIIESDQEIMVNSQTLTRAVGKARSLPPLHTWPASLKRLILMAGIAACLGAYGLFIGGIFGTVLLFLQFAFEG